MIFVNMKSDNEKSYGRFIKIARLVRYGRDL